jgi:hypothetical protein
MAGDVSDGDDEDIELNEESEEEEVAATVGVWSRCVTTFPADIL